MQVPSLSIEDVTDIAVSGMSASNVKLFRDTEKPLLSFKKLTTGKLRATDFMEFQLDHIGINDLSLQKEHSRLDVSHIVLNKTRFEPFKELRAAKIRLDGFEFENKSSGENELSCTVEKLVADNAILTEGKELSTRDFSLQSVDFKTGPHHVYLSSSRARNAHMQGTDHITLSLLDVDSLVLLQSTDKRVLKDVPSTFPLSLSKLQLMNIELKKLHDVHLENAFVSGLTSICRRSRQKPLSIGGIYNQPKEQTREHRITFSIDRIVLQQNCSLIFLDETVDSRARFDLQFKHLDLQGIGNRDKNVPIIFTSRMISGSYAEITAEGVVQRNYSPPNLDIALDVNGFGLQEVSPYARDYLGYRIERGKLFLDGNLEIDEGKLEGKGTITLKNTVMIPEETEKSKQAFSIYARPMENALKILSDKNNTLTVDIPISGDVNRPDFDFGKVARTAVTKAIRTAIKLTLGIALWPYSGVYVSADFAASSLTTAELEPVYFNTGKSQLSDGMKKYLNQVASFLEEHPHVDITLCSVSTAADQKRLSNEKRLNRLSEKRAREVKEYLVDSGGIDPDRLFHNLPEYDPSIHTGGYVELKI
jgi:outer membrane protein OmpA-like peptidoglycan-associated protein